MTLPQTVGANKKHPCYVLKAPSHRSQKLMENTRSVWHRAPPPQRSNQHSHFFQLRDTVNDRNRMLLREHIDKPRQLERPWPAPIPRLPRIAPTIRNMTRTYATLIEQVPEPPNTAKAHGGGVDGYGLDAHGEIEVVNSGVSRDFNVGKNTRTAPTSSGVQSKHIKRDRCGGDTRTGANNFMQSEITRLLHFVADAESLGLNEWAIVAKLY